MSLTKHTFFTIGHVKSDIMPDEGIVRLGGPGPFTSVALSRLGSKSSHFVTKVKKDHKYLKELMDLGITVHLLPLRDKSFEDTITTGENKLDPKGHKIQKILARQENITKDDMYRENFPEISRGDVVIVAPDIGEVSTDLFPKLRGKIGSEGLLIVSAQGYFRKIAKDGRVEKARWNEITQLRFADVVIVSNGDLTIDGEFEEEHFNQIKSICPITILTEGGHGLTLFSDGQEVHIKPLGLNKDETKDVIGAGDSATAGFVWHYATWHNIKEAAVFGVLYPALKIKGVGEGKGGIHSLPTIEQIRLFTRENNSRIQEFYKSNGIEKIPSFLEINAYPKERR